MLQGKTTEQALSVACATGAYVATQSGGTPDYNVTDINKIIN